MRISERLRTASRTIGQPPERGSPGAGSWPAGRRPLPRRGHRPAV